MPAAILLLAFMVTHDEPLQGAAPVTSDAVAGAPAEATSPGAAAAQAPPATVPSTALPPSAPIPPAPAAQQPDPAETASASAPKVGEPVAFSRRSLTLDGFGLSASAHLGLVGTFGPTRFVDELRFAPWSFLELRASFTPLPSSLMARLRVGDTTGPAGSFVIDGGVAGLSPLPASLELESGLTWSKTSSDRARVVLQVRARTRVSPQKDDAQNIVAGAAHFDIDVTPRLGVSVGFAGATTLDTPVREGNVVFAEVDRPGITWLLDSGSGNRSAMTVPLSLIYGVTESFDVDVFVTPAIYPDLGVVAGAGLRFRLF